MITSKVLLRVRYAETDGMGVVYHGNYLPWFEMGRTEMLREAGLPYRVLEEKGCLLPVTEAGLKYLRSARYDDEVEVTAMMKEKPVGLRIRIEYEVRRGEELLATGFTVHVFINREGRVVKPPEEFVLLMEKAFRA